MKRLTITYGAVTLFDAEVAQLEWTDAEGHVKVEGRVRSPGGGGILQALTSASRNKTDAHIEAKRADPFEMPKGKVPTPDSYHTRP